MLLIFSLFGVVTKTSLLRVPYQKFLGGPRRRVPDRSVDSAVDEVAALSLEVADLLGHVVELTDRTVRGTEDGALEDNLLEVSELLVGAFEKR